MDNQINKLLKSTSDTSQLTCTSTEEEIHFNSNGVLTLGVEIELQLIDSKNYNLCSRATDVLNATAHLEKIKQEFYLSTIEVTTVNASRLRKLKTIFISHSTHYNEQQRI